MNLSEEELKSVSREELIKAYNEIKDSRDRVFAVASHDLRSPFSGLLGLSEMLAAGCKDIPAEEMDEYLVTMRDSLRNTYLLLENLFDWGQIERDRYDKTIETIPLRLLADEVEESLTDRIKQKDIEIVHLYDPEQLITANSKMIEFILKNFLTNAVKFSARGSRVEIGCTVSDSCVTVFVRDYGVGISGENIEKLFSMKTSWKSHGTEGEVGTGLGLLAASRFAAAFGAELKAVSAPGKGSTFSLILTERPS